MRALIHLAVSRPVGVTIIYLAIALFGLVSLRQLAVDLMPAIDVPRVSITTRYEGVAPEEIETLLTRPIEQATSTVEGVDRIEAVSSEGLSRVQLQFAWGVELDQALDDIRVALDRIRARLPEDADPPNVYKFDLASVPVAFLGVSGSGDQRRLKYLAEDELSRALERVPGVASVTADGGLDREIHIDLDSDRLTALGISAAQVVAALARENRTVSAGEMRDRGREVVIRTEGEFTSIEDIGEVVVTTRERTAVKVSDLGAVVDSIRKVRSELYIDGQAGIRMRVYKQSGANSVDVASALQEEISRLNRSYAGRVRLVTIWDSSEFIKSAVTNVQASAGMGALLAAMVLLLFLRNVRATLVVATAIPLSVVATFGLMYSRGMTLNVISFGGLALGIGMLVDGAIVILESIHHKRSLGLSGGEAAITGADEVASAVVAGTLTTVAVFVPVVFVGGFAGVFFSEMAMVVTFALLCSLAVALTLIPMLAAKWLGDSGGQKGSDASRWSLPSVIRRPAHAVAAALGRVMDRMDDGFEQVLRSALSAPWAIVLLAVVLLASSAALAPRIGQELMPEADEGRLDIAVELPIGTPLETTSAAMKDVEKRVRSAVMPGELSHTMTSAGPRSWWRPGGSHEGSLELTLVSVANRQRGIAQVEAAVRACLDPIAGAKIQVRRGSSNILTRIVRRGEDRLSVEVRGHDLGVADQLASQIVAVMEETPGITFARPDRELGQLERVLHVDRQRASELGLGSAEVADAVENYVLGRVATRYRDGGDEFDVRVQLAGPERERIEQLPQMPIVTPTGERVALDSLVRIEERRGPSSISRINQERTLRIDAGTADRPLDDIASDLRKRLASVAVPEGFLVEVGGELSEQDSTFGSLLEGILLALFLVYATMAVQFESVRDPLVVMLSVPFAFIGVVITLLATGTTLNMNSFLGAIVLVGIVVNNAIVLVDYTNVLRREQGYAIYAAIVTAAKRRLRPILMTTLTTTVGLLPLATGAVEGSEIQAPLARTVVGGLITSMLVTLVLVPCAYYLVEGRGRAVVHANRSS